MADLIRFPTLRARRAYDELRKMGFGAEYSRFVVETLENARSNWENFGTVQGLLRGDGEKTKLWLQERGYA
jgi:hypothetical protein